MSDDDIEDITGDMKAVFNISDIDKFSLYKIENIKTNFQLNYSKLSLYEAQPQLSDILDSMQTMVEKYFKDESKNQLEIYKIKLPDGKEYNFYELKSFLTWTDLNKDTVRIIFINCFNIYDHFAKMIGVEIPMFKSDPKKKALERLFCLIPNKNDDWYNAFYAEYHKYLANFKMTDNMNSFIPYTISKMPDFDLDCNVLIIGAARSSKSTLMLHDSRQIYSSRLKLTLKESDAYLIKTHWIPDKFISDNSKGLEQLATNKAEVIPVDEGYLVGDRRKSMQQKQVDYTAQVNKYASNNNMVYTLIQNLTDLDSRIYDKANIIQLVYERGIALVFAKSANFPVLKSTYEFEKFQKDTWLLNSGMIQALHNLKRLKSFIGVRTYSNLAGNALYNEYLPFKKALQDTYKPLEVKQQIKASNPMIEIEDTFKGVK